MSEKKLGKRLLSWVLTIVLTVSLLPLSAMAENEEELYTPQGEMTVEDGQHGVSTYAGNVSVNITRGSGGSPTSTYDVFYSVNGGSLQTFNGSYIDSSASAPYSVVFFVAPKQGYALYDIAHRVAGNSVNGAFYSIVDNDTVTGCAYYKYASENANGVIANGTLAAGKLQTAIAAAKAKNCVAAFQYSKAGSGAIPSIVLDFYTVELPTLSKDIVSVTRGDDVYEGAALEAHKVRVGDIIEYSFTVDYNTALTYSDISVTDELDTDPKVMSFDGPSGGMTQEVRYANYTVKAEDIANKTLSNTAVLNYTYQATYNTGRYSSSATAKKSIAAVAAVSYAYTNSVPNAPALPASASYEEGTPVTVAEESSLAGYTFSGWQTASNIVYSSENTFAMPGQNVVFTGTWTPINYPLTVHYVYENGGEASADYRTETAYNSGYHVTSPTIAGYTPDLSVVAGTMDAVGGKEITVTYTANGSTAYKVEHYLEDLDGSVCELKETESKSGTTDEFITAAAKNYPGFTFDSSNSENKVSGTVRADGSLVLKLYYSRNSYKVTYEYEMTPAGATELPTEAAYKYGAAVNVAGTDSVTAAGHRFDGWFRDNASAEDSFTMPASDVTIVGKWTANRHKIVYRITGDHFTTDNYAAVENVAFGTSLTAIAAPSKIGYTFSGWSGLPETMPDADVTVTGSYTKNTYTVTYQITGEHFADSSYRTVDAQYGDKLTVIGDDMSRQGYTFHGWSGLPETMPAENIVVTGYYVPVDDKDNSGSTDNGGGPENPEKPDNSGSDNGGDNSGGGNSDGGNTGNGSSETPSTPSRPSRPSRPSSSTDSTVTIEDDDALGLNTTDHFAYIVGYGNGEVRPQNNITRAEVATIFFRLLTDDVRDKNLTKSNPYPDVAATSWYNTAVSTLSSMGIITGYPDGTFRPNAAITRAEFAAIAARFDLGGDKTAAKFSDIATHWARDEISIAYNNGWINGYPDGTFGPQRDITRAETVTLVNRVLNRQPETEKDLLPDMVTWTDNADKNAWYYLAVQEATNSHYYKFKTNSKYEKWTELRENRDWTLLEK